MESLTSDYEKLQKINSRLEKAIEALESEKRNLNDEVDHLHREASSREAVLRCVSLDFRFYVKGDRGQITIFCSISNVGKGSEYIYPN